MTAGHVAAPGLWLYTWHHERARFQTITRSARAFPIRRPSAWTSILPLVMAGEPCIVTTRITTSNVWALRHGRGLDDDEIVALYPGVEPPQVADAIALETRLRSVLAVA